MTMNPLLLLSGNGLARMITQGQITSNEVVSTHIEHIKRVNPALNAMVKDRFSQALAEAQRADAWTTEPTRPRPQFLGVPCSIKECFCLSGMPNTSGLVGRKNIIATKDATAVARLRRAGAIPLGVTNVSELCMWMETNNYVYGRTNNPYNPERIVGGSSGGEAAIIAAGGAPFGLGSDIGGSIRGPAFFNGIFGHKPTGGLTPNTGQFPIAHGPALRYLTTGPLARRAEDLWPLLQHLAGPDEHDEGVLPIALEPLEGVELSSLTILNATSDGRHSIHPDLREAQRRCVESFTRRKLTVTPVDSGRFRHSFEIWAAMLAAAGGPTFSSLLGQGIPINPYVHLLKWIFGRSPHTLPALGLAILERLTQIAPRRLRRLVESGQELRQELIGLLGANGVMLYPSYTRPAPKHNRPLLRPFDWVFTAIFNVMELPATQVPLGLNDQGLPLGVQVVSAPGNDHLTIALALDLEREFGGWTPPCLNL